jgi:hypothetical protein
MLLYFDRTFTETVSGNRLVELKCEHCSGVYYYLLARVGRGAATAPYMIGQKRAAQKAKEKARRDLEKRLRDESELVPCPKCQWINESLVQGFRQTYYRGWGIGAIVVGSAGTFFSLLIALIFARDLMNKSYAVMTAILGPIISLTLAFLILGWRKLMRNRIQPNCDFPHTPIIPAGTPSALIRNAETGLFEAIPRPVEAPNERKGNGWVVFQLGLNTLPQVCCVCNDSADPKCNYPHVICAGLALSIPFCRYCARSWKRRKWKTALAAAVSLIGLGYIAVSSLNLEDLLFWLLLIGTIVVAPFFGLFIAGWKTSPFRVRLVDRSRSIVLLSFQNDEYRKILVEAK